MCNRSEQMRVREKLWWQQGVVQICGPEMRIEREKATYDDGTLAHKKGEKFAQRVSTNE